MFPKQSPINHIGTTKDHEKRGHVETAQLRRAPIPHVFEVATSQRSEQKKRTEDQAEFVHAGPPDLYFWDEEYCAQCLRTVPDERRNRKFGLVSGNATSAV